MIRAAMLVCAAALAAGCGEKPQSATPSTKKADSHASQGADNRYVASGWKAGDRASWEEQMRARAQAQNEYTRTGGAK